MDLPQVRPTISRNRLGRRMRRGVLTAHIVSAGAWIGIDVVLGVLVFTATFTSSTSTEALCYQALELFAVWPLLTASILTLITGVVLGLGTNYGLIKYWWVTVKLALNLILVTLVAFALRPGVAEAARYGEALAAGTPTDASVGNLVMPPIVSSIALLVATILSVYKPWGRTRRSSTSAT
jgi:uncharacterized membrane protein